MNFIARMDITPYVYRSAVQMRTDYRAVYSRITELFVLSPDVFSSSYSKLLDRSVSPVMFMQMLCTAVLLAFIGVLLSVSVTTQAVVITQNIFGEWCLRIYNFPDIVHCPVFYKWNTTFRELDLLPSSGERAVEEG